MNRRARAHLVVLLACLGLGALLVDAAPAQSFGRTKVHYDRFRWSVYHAPHFDVYYYPEEEAFLQDIVSYAESAYLKLSEDLQHELSAKVPLIYYKTHPEFEQTNVTLSLIPDAVGAFAEPFANRMVLPIDEPPDKTSRVLTHELVHIFEYDILFGGNIGRALRSNPPLWLMEGLASYLAEDEDTFDQMVIRDAVVNGVVPSIQQLRGGSFLVYRFGNAIFTYIESKWGKEGIRNFLFEYRKHLLTGNIPKAIKEAFGVDVDEFNRQYRRYLRKTYLPTLIEKEEPETYGREIGFKRPGVFTFAPTVSPGGELVAVLANRKLDLDLWVLSGADGQPIRNLTKGFTNEYDQLVVEAFSGKRDLSWSPAGDQVATFAQHENRRILLIYDARGGKRLRKITMPQIALQSSPAFSPDGSKIAFSGNVAGIYDIYAYDLESGEITNHTDDEFVDSNPAWSADGSTLLYNRRINGFEKVFTVSATDPSRKTQLTFGASSEVMPSYSRDGRRVYYSSDRLDGIFNLYVLDTISASEKQLTDVITGVFAPVELDTLGEKPVVVFTSFFRGRYRLYRMEVDTPVAETSFAERDLEQIELQPFRSTLQLTLDETEKARYKKKWQVESPSLELGVTDDGTFLGNTLFTVADLLGDHRWILGASTVGSFSQFDLYRLDLSRRVNLA
ncbi:MAG: TolB family protein, partial [Acidobacteriota bacterium]